MEQSRNTADLTEALNAVEKAVEHIRDEQDYYILDTKVRILLKLKRDNEAFAIVKQVLAEVPEFGDFQDFYDNARYQRWLAKQ